MEARRLSSFVDASTLYWREFWNAYAFPPFCLVGTCLQKVILPQATLTIVVLLWCTRAWFTKLLSLLMDHPRIVRVTKGVFHNPILGQMTIQPQAKSTGMQDTGERLIKRNIPRDNTDHHHTIVERIEGTQNQYSVYLWKWDEFFVQRQINSMICLLKVCPIRPSILHAQRYQIVSWAKIYPTANFQSPVTHLLNTT